MERVLILKEVIGSKLRLTHLSRIIDDWSSLIATSEYILLGDINLRVIHYAYSLIWIISFFVALTITTL